MNPRKAGTGARDLEEEFFARENASLLERLRRKSDEEARKEGLRKVLKIKDDAHVNRIMALGIGPETALALRLIPLVFVAWADGKIDERERDALIRAARQEGVDSEEAGLGLLQNWLQTRPDPSLLEMWKKYVKGIWNHFSREEQFEMRKNLLDSARGVAEAAGGFLGLTSRVSSEEKAVLEDLESLLD